MAPATFDSANYPTSKVMYLLSRYSTTSIALGAFPPSGNGEPATGLRVPLELTENTEMSLDALHTKTKFPASLAAIPSGPLMLPCPPLGNGEPESALRAPVLKLNVNAEMVASAVFG